MTKAHYILFVDDEAGNRLSFKAYFRRKFRVLLASDAATAKGMLQVLPISVVVSDQRMPGMSGLELFAWLRTYDESIVRVLASGSTSNDDKEHALAVGTIHSWVQKPWDVQELERQLVRWQQQWMGGI